MLLLATAALAGTWDFQEQFAITWFGKGLRLAVRAEDQVDTPWRKEGDLLLDAAFLAPGMYGEITPAYARIGPRFHFQPAAVFDISVEGLYTNYFGTFTGVTDFATADADYSEAALDQEATVARAGRSHGWRFGASPSLQAKVGPVIVALPTDIFVYHQDIPPGATGPYWYEPQLDALVRWDDVSFGSSAIVFFEAKAEADEDSRFAWVGVHYYHQYVLGTQDQQQKLGPMFVGKPVDAAWFPTVVFMAQAYLQAPTRSIVPPYLALALVWSQRGSTD
jgi:hypothetical protein